MPFIRKNNKNAKSTQQQDNKPFNLGIFSPEWSKEFKKGAGRKPSWQIKTQNGYKNTPTVAETEQERLRLLKSLQRGIYASDPIAKLLAKPLDKCAPKARCKQLYCPTCAQKQAVMFTREVFAFQYWHKPVWRASLIPDTTIPQDSLDAHLFDDLAKRLRDLCVETNLQHAVAGFDMSVNYVVGNRNDLAFAPHAMLYFQTDMDIELWKTIAKKHFPASPSTPKPVFVEQLNENLAGFGYGYKTKFGMRGTIPSTANSRQDTSADVLTVPLRNEIAYVMRKMRFRDRLFLHNVKFKKNPANGLIELVKTNQNGTKQSLKLSTIIRS